MYIGLIIKIQSWLSLGYKTCSVVYKTAVIIIKQQLLSVESLIGMDRNYQLDK